jgi:hypothetical protein
LPTYIKPDEHTKAGTDKRKVNMHFKGADGNKVIDGYYYGTRGRNYPRPFEVKENFHVVFFAGLIELPAGPEALR